MNDVINPQQATPYADLIAQIMDCRVPKNEREWAAAREIQRLSAELAKTQPENERLQAAHDHQYEVAGDWLREAERYSRENEELCDELKRLRHLETALAEAKRETDDQARDCVAAIRVAQDAERFDWFFGPADKSKFMQAYMAGVRAGFTADHWRETIDTYMRQEKQDE